MRVVLLISNPAEQPISTCNASGVKPVRTVTARAGGACSSLSPLGSMIRDQPVWRGCHVGFSLGVCRRLVLVFRTSMVRLLTALGQTVALGYTASVLLIPCSTMRRREAWCWLIL
jgi:hypothetical protein